MDLYVIQVDLRVKKSILLRKVKAAINEARSRHPDREIMIKTMEYDVYKLLEAELPVRFLPYELSDEADGKIQLEANQFARDLVERVGSDPECLSGGINVLDCFLFWLSMQLRSILGIKHLVETISSSVTIYFTGLQVFDDRTEYESPILGVFRIGAGRKIAYRKFAKRVTRKLLLNLRSLVRPSLKSRVPAYPSGDGNRVLFVTGDTKGRPENSEPIVYILRELANHNDLAPFVAADNSYTENYLKERGISCVAKRDAIIDSQARSHMSKSLPIFRERTAEAIRAFGPASIDGLMASMLRTYLTWSMLSQVYSRISWLEEVLDEFRPDILVIFATYSYFGWIASRLARARGIPTLGGNYRLPLGVKPHPQFFHFDVTNFIAGYGEQFRDALVGSGIHPSKYIPVGNPKFDGILKRERAVDRSYVCKELGVNPEKRIFLVTTYLISPGSKEWVPALVRQVKKLDANAFKLIIKTHPDENSQPYERILEESGFVGAVVTKDAQIYPLLNASDILFTDVSVTGSEAILFDIPIICINLSGYEYRYRYDEYGVAILVEREEDILPAINAVLNDDQVKLKLKAAREVAKKLYTVDLDGRASERFVHAIRQVINTSKSENLTGPRARV
jgi:hypothetical protein